ncbi:MAG: PilC/PilY family type IV pilus protein [Desulfobacula sp.]|jgi:type IV pilus assembly protein PilY1|nr:PilC/PilY family type IV pilus protein [Desulfobacula sp.]
MLYKSFYQEKIIAFIIQHIKVYFNPCLAVLLLILYVFIAILPLSPALAADCITIADAPLETPFSVSSVNVMFVLDDSGSMDWEMLVTTDAENNPDGLFMVDGVEKYYLYDEVKEVIDYQGDPDDSLNLYPLQNYGNAYLEGNDRALWKSQWAGHNKMYYDPLIDYTPWYTTDNSLVDADPDNPRFHPWNPAPTVGMSTNFVTISGESESTLIADDISNDTKIFEMNIKQDWTESFDGDRIYDGDEHYTTVIGESAQWYLDVIDTEDYDVYAYVTDEFTNSDTRSQYTISQGGIVLYTVSDVDQNDSENGWLYFGSHSFSAGEVTIKVERTASSTGYTAADAIKLVPEGADTGSIDIPIAHYFVISSVDNFPYLVILDSNQIKYYKLLDANSDDKVDPGELTQIASPPSDVGRSQAGFTDTQNYIRERQNFANWYSYYRKRWYAAVNALGKSMPYLIGKNVGYRSINSDKSHPKLVQPVVRLDGSGTNTKMLLDELYSYPLDLDYASTPLRIGLEMVGLYYDVDNVTGGLEDVLLTSPLENDPYASCTQNYAIILTDGAWNGGAPLTATGDKDAGPPFADSVPGMLADVAYAYYDTDLAPDVENLVPTDFIDNNSAQHMVTYGITFGATGHLNPDDYSDIALYNVNINDRITPDWPTPALDFQDKIDDLYHATVNARGKYYSSSNPKELENILQEVVQTIGSEVGSGASVSINGEEIKPDSNNLPHIFQAGYVSDGWSGGVMAFEIAQTGVVQNGEDEELWFASEVMDLAESSDPNSDYWDTKRVIATYDGTVGKRFRYDQLSIAQQSSLDPDAVLAADILNYLRGDHSREMRETNGIFRNRAKMKWDDVSQAMVVHREPTIMGDVVHSAPHYVDYGSTETEDKGVLFVGANDGMLHAFNASDGSELFAYVPNQVFDNLKDLVNPDYVHKYYVDMTPFTADMGNQTFLVGSLGKGGKGFYCLDITDLSDITTAVENNDNAAAETALAAKIKWEYPSVPGSDNDLGYTFSRAFLVNSMAGWVVIAGNGYNSVNGKAILYILDPSTGAVLKKIDTLSGTCNGLSTPLLTDVNNDGKVDYAYAGDMNGNFWKFDLTDADYNNWEIAFNSAGVPVPLFQALDVDGKPQPITSKPDAMFHCEKTGYMIVFGTGRYLAEVDFTDTSQQTIYGIWDYGDDSDDSESLGSFTRTGASKLSSFDATDYVTLLEQTQVASVTEGDDTLRVISDNIPNWATIDDETSGQNPNPGGTVSQLAHAGWYFDLPISKERVAQRVEIRNNIAIVISYSLDSDASADLCKPSRSGSSIVHEMDACSGARRPSATFDINDDGIIDENDFVEIPNPDPTDTDNPTIRVPPTGIQKPGLIYPPKILIVDDSEIKYFSSSRRTIETVREVTETTGMYYWRELRN